jgi:hypothetical protein
MIYHSHKIEHDNYVNGQKLYYAELTTQRPVLGGYWKEKEKLYLCYDPSDAGKGFYLSAIDRPYRKFDQEAIEYALFAAMVKERLILSSKSENGDLEALVKKYQNDFVIA